MHAGSMLVRASATVLETAHVDCLSPSSCCAQIYPRQVGRRPKGYPGEQCHLCMERAVLARVGLSFPSPPSLSVHLRFACGELLQQRRHLAVKADPIAAQHMFSCHSVSSCLSRRPPLAVPEHGGRQGEAGAALTRGINGDLMTLLDPKTGRERPKHGPKAGCNQVLICRSQVARAPSRRRPPESASSFRRSVPKVSRRMDHEAMVSVP